MAVMGTDSAILDGLRGRIAELEGWFHGFFP